MYMYALGLDPNPTVTGWCVVRGEEWLSGVIKRHDYDPDSGFADWEVMALDVMRWMEYDRYDFVAIEDTHHDKNARVTIELSKLVGAIGANARLNHITCYYLKTAKIDSLTGVIGGRKQGNKNLARLLLGDGISEHEADACAAVIAGMGVHKTKSWEKAG